MLKEADNGAVFEEPGFVGVAALAVAFFVENVAGVEVGCPVGGGGHVGHDAEEGRPCVFRFVDLWFEW